MARGQAPLLPDAGGGARALSASTSPVSLLLPNHNNGRVLDGVLAGLARNTTYPQTEVVAVDDGSTDGSIEILRRWRDSGRLPNFSLIEKTNTGAIDTLNTALDAASGHFCVQLDSDATVETHGWVERMLGLMEADDAVGVVTAKVVMDSGVLHACGVNVVGPEGLHDRGTSIAEPAGRRLWHHRVRRVSEGGGGSPEHETSEVDSGIGCCMMYRRADALVAGGYDKGFSPVWLDDIDLCMSIRALGRKAFYLPSVRVVHHIRGRQNEPVRARLQPRRLVRALVARGTRRVPLAARAPIERRYDLDLDMYFTAEQRARLRRHYRHWDEKWGWSLCNPDLARIERRWGSTEVCWGLAAGRREHGERIVRAYENAHPGGPP